jgi:hypothetical protein
MTNIKTAGAVAASLVAVLFLLACSGSPNAQAENLPAAIGDSNRPPSKVIAYYFHTTVRCTACTRIENLAHEVVERDFAEHIKAGQLEWRTVNVQHAENQHFIRDFRLVTKSVVLVREANGKATNWKNLDKVWELVRSQTRYQNYVREELKSFLGGS